MNLTTSVLKSPSNRLPRWMIANEPGVKSTSAFVLKGTYPAYLFEILAPGSDPGAHSVEYKGKTYQVAVKLDIDEAGDPPNSYFVELIRWYGMSKARPLLSKILSAAEEVAARTV